MKYLDYSGLIYLWNKLKEIFVTKSYLESVIEGAIKGAY